MSSIYLLENSAIRQDYIVLQKNKNSPLCHLLFQAMNPNIKEDNMGQISRKIRNIILGNFDNLNEFGNFCGMRFYNPGLFTLTGKSMLRTFVSTLRLHAAGFSSSFSKVLMPYVLSLREVEGTIDARTKRRMSEMGNVYVLPLSAAFAAFCNSVASEKAVYPLDDNTVRQDSRFIPGCYFFAANKILYIAVSDLPMTATEKNEIIDSGFPVETLYCK